MAGKSLPVPHTGPSRSSSELPPPLPFPAAESMVCFREALLLGARSRSEGSPEKQKKVSKGKQPVLQAAPSREREETEGLEPSRMVTDLHAEAREVRTTAVVCVCVGCVLLGVGIQEVRQLLQRKSERGKLNVSFLICHP